MSRSLFFQPINARLNERYCGSEAELRAALTDIATNAKSPRSIVIVDTIALTSPLILDVPHYGLEMRFVGLNAKLVPGAGRTLTSAIQITPSSPSTSPAFVFRNLRVEDGVTSTFLKVFDTNGNSPAVFVQGGQTTVAGTWVARSTGWVIQGVQHTGGPLALYNINQVSDCVFGDLTLGLGAVLLGGGNKVANIRFIGNATAATNTFGNQIVGCSFSGNINLSAGNHSILAATRYTGTLTAAGGTDVFTGNMNF